MLHSGPGDMRSIQGPEVQSASQGEGSVGHGRVYEILEDALLGAWDFISLQLILVAALWKQISMDYALNVNSRCLCH